MIKYENMTNREKGYWIALMMAIDTIDEHCENKNINLENIEVKQTAIKHFISETHVKIEEDLNYIDELEKKRHKNFTPFNIFSKLTKTVNA